MPGPIISNISPTVGTSLGPNQFVQFDVTDATPLVLTLIAVYYPNRQQYEVVFDGTNMVGNYAASSTVLAISNGHRFTIVRSPNWPDSPQVHVWAVDSSGGQLTTEEDWLFSPLLPAPTVPSGPVQGDCDGILFDQAHFLGMFDRTFPPSYIQPMKDYPNSGYEIFQSFAKVGERVSEAIEHLECGSFIIFAQGGAYATGNVQFSRLTDTAGAVTIKAGSIVTTSSGGRDFLVMQDLPFSATDFGPFNCPVRAVAFGWEWNVPGQRVTAGGETIPGEIDTIKLLVEDPPYGDRTFLVSQKDPMSDGRAPMLDGLGADRGIRRLGGEPDPAYALRLRTLPDTVSPNAILRYLHARIDPLKLPAPDFEFIETWDIRYQTSWDAPSPNSGTPTYDQGVPPTNPDYDSNLFSFDDQRAGTTPTFKDRWLDDQEYRGAFIVTLPITQFYDVGFAYDDTAMGPNDFAPPGSLMQRGTGAYDITLTANNTVPQVDFPACYDGYDLVGAAFTLSLWQHLQKIKEAGVAAIIELQPYNGLQ